MAKVLVPIADGTEELEAVTIIDMLRRADAEVFVASVMSERKTVIASRGVKLEADGFLSECMDHVWDMIVLPGGMPGAEHLGCCLPLIDLLKRQLQENRFTAAICASPAIVLAGNSLIDGREATCYPGFQHQLESNGAILVPGNVVVDGTLITSMGPGTAMSFALRLIEHLYDKNKAESVASAALAKF